MAWSVHTWPRSVFPEEVEDECPEALEAVITVIREMERLGPAPEVRQVKTLGRKLGSLWQMNLRVEGRQVRILYAPYDSQILLFRIHKKSSKGEQDRGYELAIKRKRSYELHVRQQS